MADLDFTGSQRRFIVDSTPKVRHSVLEGVMVYRLPERATCKYHAAAVSFTSASAVSILCQFLSSG